ncbi:hypothetical protein BJY24_001249 [Nocardia transvalensis]|uniref:Uncharacterized protein n=1 Tax=Nocardia transvalensis TaxID=37333 RepID=A0A7W9PA92_9NOCA|nr:hypothetical protein [Nocardia transvalensis]
MDPGYPCDLPESLMAQHFSSSIDGGECAADTGFDSPVPRSPVLLNKPNCNCKRRVHISSTETPLLETPQTQHTRRR